MMEGYLWRKGPHTNRWYFAASLNHRAFPPEAEVVKLVKTEPVTLEPVIGVKESKNDD